MFIGRIYNAEDEEAGPLKACFVVDVKLAAFSIDGGRGRCFRVGRRRVNWTDTGF